MLKTAFVSGANRGLGLALVTRLLQQGITVFAGARGPSDELDALTRQHGSALHRIGLDVSNMGSVREAAANVARRVASLDALVNNAAVQFDRPAPLESLDLESLRFGETMNVNAMGPLRLTQQLLPLLKAGAGKLIVNISSEAGSIGDCWRESEFVYCMSKAALNMQTKLLANHLAPLGFRVLAIQPGWMRTDMGGAGAALDPQESARGIVDRMTERMHAPASDQIFIDYQGKALRW